MTRCGTFAAMSDFALPQPTVATLSPRVLLGAGRGSASFGDLVQARWNSTHAIADDDRERYHAKQQELLRRFQAEGSLRPLSILCGNGGLFLDFEMERGADGAMTGYAFPDMLVDVVRLQKAGRRDAAHDLFDAHLPLLRYEQQPGVGLAVRKYVMMRRGVLASDAQRKPGSALSEDAKGEVEYLLQRLARQDARAGRLAA